LAGKENDSKTSGSSSVLSIAAAIIVAGLFIAGGVYFGLQGLPNAGNGNVAGTRNNPTPIQVADTQAPIIEDAATTVTVSVDDDPFLGSEDAPVTVIEFSDFECPFCQRSFEQILPSLRTQYIDTGKVKFVYRNLPLGIHDPVATEEALAANCALEQGGNEKYFQFHDELFNRTKGNGVGLGEDGLSTLANDLGLDVAEFDRCLEEKRYTDEVAKDMEDAQAAGATGTPTFFVGKSTPDGNIEAEIIVGAVPFTTLQTTIDKYLEN